MLTNSQESFHIPPLLPVKSAEVVAQKLAQAQTFKVMIKDHNRADTKFSFTHCFIEYHDQRLSVIDISTR